MAIGSITITDPGGPDITFQCAAADYRLGYQANTLSSALTPSRSTYGTLQNSSFPSTVSPKRLWVFSGVFLTAAQLTILDSMLTTRQPLLWTVPTFLTLTDDCKLKAILGSSSAIQVRLVAGEDFLEDEVYLDKSTKLGVWRVSFSAVEV